jgi:hypothetical protein
MATIPQHPTHKYHRTLKRIRHKTRRPVSQVLTEEKQSILIKKVNLLLYLNYIQSNLRCSELQNIDIILFTYGL